jgi:Na+/H+ antiporter NhaC
MKTSEVLGVTLNVSILAVFYTALGGIISYLLYYFVDEHDEEWEKRSTGYQVYDVSFQLSIIGILTFWITYLMREAAPIFPVSKELDLLVDTYVSGLFFAYAMFLFINYLDSKIQYLYHELLDKHVEKMFPSRKMDKKKTT